MELLPFLRERQAQLVIATDRECGIEPTARDAGLSCRRFEYPDRDTFSEDVAAFFRDEGVDGLVLLYYSRFVGAALYDAFETLNFHPSILPLFPGLHPIRRMLKARAPLIGATVHRVDATCDAGPILGQIANSYTQNEADHVAFLQRTFLSLAALEAHIAPSDAERIRYLNASLGLTRPAHDFFRAIEARERRTILP